MKKAMLYTLVATLFVFSCKKDHSKDSNGTNPAGKIYKVELNVSGFTQTITNSTSKKVQGKGLKTDAVTGISGYLDQLYYYVFHSDGTFKLVHTLVQDSTSSNFGNISDSLSAGAYTIIIAAGKPGLTSSLSVRSPGTSYLTGTNYIFYKGGPFAQWKDTFYGQINITVTGDVNQDINLNRIVGQLEVDITDAIPATANSISITVDLDDLNFLLNSQTPTQAAKPTYTTTIPASAKGKTNYTFRNLIGNTATPFNVTIVCYDAAKKVLGTALVTNVTCQKNKRTILTGSLFGTNNNFTVSLNDTWNATPINIPF
ncbi:hypothetical protein [Mucilaginibacter sp.]|uniref:hypothetical protein n=1 Tax=Mucilaginibacter sp. TaxID=1882438 RepID=UPI0026183023|nr:hypothetical protein [Mucilaginibacter sp.]